MPRKRIQRSFMQWWKQNRQRFDVQVHILTVSHVGIRLKFAKDYGCIFARLSQDDLSVIVEVEGLFWDMLLSLDVCPVRSLNGYSCALCEQSDQIWPTRDALWVDHLFEPFLEWVNARLAKSCGIKLTGKPGSSTGAELVMKSDLTD